MRIYEVNISRESSPATMLIFKLAESCTIRLTSWVVAKLLICCWYLIILQNTRALPCPEIMCWSRLVRRRFFHVHLLELPDIFHLRDFNFQNKLINLEQTGARFYLLSLLEILFKYSLWFSLSIRLVKGEMKMANPVGERKSSSINQTNHQTIKQNNQTKQKCRFFKRLKSA